MASKLEENSFLFGTNTGFIEQVYGRYLSDPNSVDPEWRRFFAGLQDNVADALREIQGASWAPRTARSSADVAEAQPSILFVP